MGILEILKILIETLLEVNLIQSMIFYLHFHEFIKYGFQIPTIYISIPSWCRNFYDIKNMYSFRRP